MSDFKEKLDGYTKKLKELDDQCSKAEKDIIVAETNYNNLVKAKDEAVAQLEEITGAKIGEVPELLKTQEAELESIMSKLMQIDTTGEISDEDINLINEIIKEFDIEVPAEE